MPPIPNKMQISLLTFISAAEKVRQRGDVIGDAGDQSAYRRAVEKADWQLLYMCKQRVAQIMQYSLACILQQPAAGGREHEKGCVPGGVEHDVMQQQPIIFAFDAKVYGFAQNQRQPDVDRGAKQHQHHSNDKM